MEAKDMMQTVSSKAEVLASPVVMGGIGSFFMTLGAYLEDGLPVIVQYGNGILIIMAVLLAISKLRSSRTERKILEIQLAEAEKEAGQ